MVDEGEAVGVSIWTLARPLTPLFRGRGWSHRPWRGLRAVSKWHLGPWVSEGLGSAGLAVGLDGLRGLFQPK